MNNPTTKPHKPNLSDEFKRVKRLRDRSAHTAKHKAQVRQRRKDCGLKSVEAPMSSEMKAFFAALDHTLKAISESHADALEQEPDLKADRDHTYDAEMTAHVLKQLKINVVFGQLREALEEAAPPQFFASKTGGLLRSRMEKRRQKRLAQVRADVANRTFPRV